MLHARGVCAAGTKKQGLSHSYTYLAATLLESKYKKKKKKLPCSRYSLALCGHAIHDHLLT